MASAARGTLTIGSSPAPAIFWLPPIIAEFQKRRPDVRIRLVSRSSRDIKELAESESFDVGIAEAPFTRREQVSRRYRFEMVAVTKLGSDLARHQTLTPQLIAKSRLVAVKGALWTDAEISRAFEKSGVDAPVTAECDYMASAIGLVQNGGGVCFIDAVSAAQIKTNELVALKFSPSIKYEIGLFKPARGSSSLLATAFEESLDKALRPFDV